jgi:hypothetical protein
VGGKLIAGRAHSKDVIAVKGLTIRNSLSVQAELLPQFYVLNVQCLAKTDQGKEGDIFLSLFNF